MPISRKETASKKQEIRKFIFTAAFLWLMTATSAQVPQSYPLNLRNFDENKVKEIKKNPEFDYSEKVEYYDKYDHDWQWKQWRYEEYQRNKKNEHLKAQKFQEASQALKTTLKENFIYVAIAILLICLILMLLGFDVKPWFTFNKKVKKLKKEVVVCEDNLATISQEQLEVSLRKAIAQQKYNDALRYAYLKALQLLAKNNLIELSQQKTNADYQIELQEKKASLSESFKAISKIFTYIRYGEFVVSQEQFVMLFPHFESFYQKI